MFGAIAQLVALPALALALVFSSGCGGGVSCPGDDKCTPCTDGKCKWNDKGLVVSRVYWAKDAPAETRVTYKYDGDGRLLEEAADDGKDGSIEDRNVFTWDKRGNKLSHIFYQRGKMYRTDVWTYNEANQMRTLTRSFGGEKAVQRTTYDNGKETLVEHDEDGDGKFERSIKMDKGTGQ